MRVTHSFTDDSATIRLEGLARPVRMLHLTDTHGRRLVEIQAPVTGRRLRPGPSRGEGGSPSGWRDLPR